MAYSAMFNSYELLIAQKASLRPKLHYLSPDLFPANGPNSKSLIEITGSSNSGKTLLLTEIVARTILPTYFNGKDAGVILIDLDHKFSVPRLQTICEKVIKNSGEKTTPEDMQFAIELRLQSVQILNCYTPDQFEMAVDMLEDMLVANHDIALFAIDNIGAFYWQDTEKVLIKKETHYKNHIARLKGICSKHNIVCAYTVDSNYVQPRALRPNVDYYFEMKQKPSNQSEANHSLGMMLANQEYTIEKTTTIDESGINFT